MWRTPSTLLTKGRGIQEALSCFTHGSFLQAVPHIQFLLILDPAGPCTRCSFVVEDLEYWCFQLCYFPDNYPLLPILTQRLPPNMQSAKGYFTLLSFVILKTIERGHMTAICFPKQSRFWRFFHNWYHTWTFISSEINYSSVKPLETTTHFKCSF